MEPASGPRPDGDRAGRSYSDRRSRWEYGRGLVREEGLLRTLERLATYPNTPWIRWGWAPLVLGARAASGARTFEWGGRRLRYGPAIGERAVELPIATAFLEGRTTDPDAVLEVGNVLHRWAPFPHRVVDKYETVDGVINVDVLDYRPARKVPTIVSISTLEHVGFDETPRVPGAFRRAVEHLWEECLAPGGRMLLTLPMGYNPEVDEWLCRGRIPTSSWTVYRRRGLRNLWTPAPSAEAAFRAVPYPPYSFRRHRLAQVAVGVLEKPGAP